MALYLGVVSPNADFPQSAQELSWLHINGVTELAAQEIIEAIEVEMLAPYRPDREFAEIRRY